MSNRAEDGVGAEGDGRNSSLSHQTWATSAASGGVEYPPVGIEGVRALAQLFRIEKEVGRQSLPQLRSSERDELRAMDEGLTTFSLASREAEEKNLGDPFPGAAFAGLVAAAEEEERVYGQYLSELARQVGHHCRERGMLLERVRGLYRDLFRRVPQAARRLQKEMDAQADLSKRVTAELVQTRRELLETGAQLQSFRQRYLSVAEDLDAERERLRAALQDAQQADEHMAGLRAVWHEQKGKLTEEVRLLREQRDAAAAREQAKELIERAERLAARARQETAALSEDVGCQTPAFMLVNLAAPGGGRTHRGSLYGPGGRRESVVSGSGRGPVLPLAGEQGSHPAATVYNIAYAPQHLSPRSRSRVLGMPAAAWSGPAGQGRTAATEAAGGSDGQDSNEDDQDSNEFGQGAGGEEETGDCVWPSGCCPTCGREGPRNRMPDEPAEAGPGSVEVRSSSEKPETGQDPRGFMISVETPRGDSPRPGVVRAAADECGDDADQERAAEEEDEHEDEGEDEDEANDDDDDGESDTDSDEDEEQDDELDHVGQQEDDAGDSADEDRDESDESHSGDDEVLRGLGGTGPGSSDAAASSDMLRLATRSVTPKLRRRSSILVVRDWSAVAIPEREDHGNDAEPAPGPASLSEKEELSAPASGTRSKNPKKKTRAARRKRANSGKPKAGNARKAGTTDGDRDASAEGDDEPNERPETAPGAGPSSDGDEAAAGESREPVDGQKKRPAASRPPVTGSRSASGAAHDPPDTADADSENGPYERPLSRNEIVEHLGSLRAALESGLRPASQAAEARQRALSEAGASRAVALRGRGEAVRSVSGAGGLDPHLAIVPGHPAESVISFATRSAVDDGDPLNFVGIGESESESDDLQLGGSDGGGGGAGGGDNCNGDDRSGRTSSDQSKDHCHRDDGNNRDRDGSVYENVDEDDEEDGWPDRQLALADRTFEGADDQQGVIASPSSAFGGPASAERRPARGVGGVHATNLSVSRNRVASLAVVSPVVEETVFGLGGASPSRASNASSMRSIGSARTSYSTARDPLVARPPLGLDADCKLVRCLKSMDQKADAAAVKKSPWQFLLGDAVAVGASAAGASGELGPPLTPRSNPKRTGPVLSLPWLLGWIRYIYSRREEHEQASGRSGSAVAPFPDFFLDVMKAKYGLSELVTRKARHLLHCLAHYRSKSAEVEVFARFLEEKAGEGELSRMLAARRAALSQSIGIVAGGSTQAAPVSSPSPAPDGAREADGAGQAASDVRCSEFLCLNRVKAALEVLFVDEQTRHIVLSSLQKSSRLWDSESSPWTLRELRALWRKRADKMGPGVNPSSPRFAAYEAERGVHPRFVDMQVFLAAVEEQVARKERQQQDAEWISELFSCVDLNLDGWIDAVGFATIFGSARPRYSSREVSNLFVNVTRQAGTQQVSLVDFQRLALRLVADGMVFVLPSKVPAGEGRSRQAVVFTVAAHWASFRGRLDSLLERLDTLGTQSAVEEAGQIRAVRALLESALYTSVPDPERVADLYRSLLHAALLADRSNRGDSAPPLDAELTQLEDVIALREADERSSTSQR